MSILYRQVWQVSEEHARSIAVRDRGGGAPQAGGADAAGG